MFKKEFETVWQTHLERYRTAMEKKREQEWVKSCASHCVSLSFIALISAVVVARDVKPRLGLFQPSHFSKKMANLSASDVERAIRYFMLDFLSDAFLHPAVVQVAEKNKMSVEAFKQSFCEVLGFEALDYENLELVTKKQETYLHTIGLLTSLGLKEDARNEAIVLLIEDIKQNLHDTLFSFFARLDIK